jgi:hypothetical protein
MIFHRFLRKMSDKEQTTKTIQKKAFIPVVTILAIIFIYQTSIMVDADALTRYYNCTSRVANKNGTLSLQNIENCYDQIFKGAKQAERDEADAARITPPPQ